MTSRSISVREITLLLILSVLLLAGSYYKFFYQPLQQELTDLANQSSQLDNEIASASAKLTHMREMQAELDEILSQPADEITEIAPYDNAKIVMSQLNGILSASENYNLSFRDPSFTDDGMVRRYVTMNFDCPSYANAKSIIQALTASRWRCLINSISIAVNGDQFRDYGVLTAAQREALARAERYRGILNCPVTVSASIVFFESTALNR